MGQARVHKGCGGVVKQGVCTKCGKKWGKVKGFLTGEIEDKEMGFDSRAYRRRIRDGSDLISHGE